MSTPMELVQDEQTQLDIEMALLWKAPVNSPAETRQQEFIGGEDEFEIVPCRDHAATVMDGGSDEQLTLLLSHQS
jgi:hypothetical protein